MLEMLLCVTGRGEENGQKTQVQISGVVVINEFWFFDLGTDDHERWLIDFIATRNNLTFNNERTGAGDPGQIVNTNTIMHHHAITNPLYIISVERGITAAADFTDRITAVEHLPLTTYR